MDECMNETNALDFTIEELLKRLQIVEFAGGNVPVSVAAKVYNKDKDWVRAGIVVGWLPIGVATRNGGQVTSINEMRSAKGRINYFISPKKLYEDTGFIWHGERD